MEVSFGKEARMLRCGAGETFHGEGILAITKALLQSGVAYVGGYQGAPVSHLLDVLVQSKDYLDELGVHVEACANEASAAAMLGASIHYPLRGAVTWKSIVGTNVAADALSNLSSPGVTGGALIVVGEDYGEGASVIQERTYAYALKSSLLPARPAARPRAHGATWSSTRSRCRRRRTCRPCWSCASAPATCAAASSAGTTCAPAVSTRAPDGGAGGVRLRQLAHPPVTFRQEKLKSERAHSGRAPLHRRARAQRALARRRTPMLGIIVQGGLYNSLVARAAAASAWPMRSAAARSRSSCSTSPIRWCPRRSRDFCAGKRAVLVLEEGQPEFIEQEIATMLRRRGHRHAAARQGPAAAGRRIHGRGDRARALPRSSHATRRSIALADGSAWLDGDARAPRRGRAGARRAAAGAAAEVLHRLPRAAGVRGAQARAAGHRPACTSPPTSAATRSRPSSRSRFGPLDPRLRHEPRAAAPACRR